MISMSERTEIQEKRKTIEKTVSQHCLVLYNDDVNTFDHVINCLIRICSHELIQAEQCAWLVHQKGHIGCAKQFRCVLNCFAQSM